uniref:Uncharacterized protein n=1 Tax=Rhizophora mucronata TaxID=61149 RepID=A0A2P2NEI8_RHIMU
MGLTVPTKSAHFMLYSFPYLYFLGTVINMKLDSK